jgi:hypothetical protein
MSEMIERMVAAIREIRVGEHYCLYPHEAEEIARAVLETIREPTQKMIEAGGETLPVEWDYWRAAKECHVAMIDAALATQTA